MRVFVAALLGGLAVLALPLAGRADTVRFTAQLAGDADNPATPAAVRGSASVSLDTATKIVRWTIEYSGLARPPREVGCGALEPPGAPAIRLTSNLTSPITGSKTLTDSEIAALTAGGWACVINGEGEEAEIGGVLQPQR
jgi:hypothetical protein